MAEQNIASSQGTAQDGSAEPERTARGVEHKYLALRIKAKSLKELLGLYDRNRIDYEVEASVEDKKPMRMADGRGYIEELGDNTVIKGFTLRIKNPPCILSYEGHTLTMSLDNRFDTVSLGVKLSAEKTFLRGNNRWANLLLRHAENWYRYLASFAMSPAYAVIPGLINRIKIEGYDISNYPLLELHKADLAEIYDVFTDDASAHSEKYLAQISTDMYDYRIRSPKDFDLLDEKKKYTEFRVMEEDGDVELLLSKERAYFKHKTSDDLRHLGLKERLDDVIYKKQNKLNLGFYRMFFLLIFCVFTIYFVYYFYSTWIAESIGPDILLALILETMYILLLLSYSYKYKNEYVVISLMEGRTLLKHIGLNKDKVIQLISGALLIPNVGAFIGSKIGAENFKDLVNPVIQLILNTFAK